MPVSFLSGNTSPFLNNSNVVITFVTTGDKGDQGISGYSGYSGISGYSGYSGISGYSGAAGTTLAQAAFDAANTKMATSGGSFTGTVSFINTRETLQRLTGATGNVTHDCANSMIFIHDSPSANFTLIS